MKIVKMTETSKGLQESAEALAEAKTLYETYVQETQQRVRLLTEAVKLAESLFWEQFQKEMHPDSDSEHWALGAFGKEGDLSTYAILVEETEEHLSEEDLSVLVAENLKMMEDCASSVKH